jgi:hypothetical protein
MLPPLSPVPLPPPSRLPAPLKPHGIEPLDTARVGDGDKPGAAPAPPLDLRL